MHSSHVFWGLQRYWTDTLVKQNKLTRVNVDTFQRSSEFKIQELRTILVAWFWDTWKLGLSVFQSFAKLVQTSTNGLSLETAGSC